MKKALPTGQALAEIGPRKNRIVLADLYLAALAERIGPLISDDDLVLLAQLDITTERQYNLFLATARASAKVKS